MQRLLSGAKLLHYAEQPMNFLTAGVVGIIGFIFTGIAVVGSVATIDLEREARAKIIARQQVDDAIQKQRKEVVDEPIKGE